MMCDNTVVALLIVLVIVVAVWYAYEHCKLDKYLPADRRKCDQGGFVGSMGQQPHLVPCAFPVSDDWMFNRCNYA